MQIFKRNSKSSSSDESYSWSETSTDSRYNSERIKAIKSIAAKPIPHLSTFTGEIEVKQSFSASIPPGPPSRSHGLRVEISNYVTQSKATESFDNLLSPGSSSSGEKSIFGKKEIREVESNEKLRNQQIQKCKHLRSQTPERHYKFALSKLLSSSVCLALVCCVCFFAWRPTNFFLAAKCHLNGSETIQTPLFPKENRRSLSCQNSSISGMSFMKHILDA